MHAPSTVRVQSFVDTAKGNGAPVSAQNIVLSGHIFIAPVTNLHSAPKSSDRANSDPTIIIRESTY